jgi:DNA-binding beta-propeller fold protein YncE
VDVCLIREGAQVLVLGSEGRRAEILERGSLARVRSIALPAPASGMAVAGTTAYITTCEPAGHVLVLDLDAGTVRRRLRVGHTPMAPVLSPDGHTLYVADRFDNAVSLVDLASGARRTVAVVREPVALVLGAEGKRLFVANHLPLVTPALDDENPDIAAEVTVIDTVAGKVLANIRLPNGSQGLRGVGVSPDGRTVVVAHVLSHYTVPPARVAGGAMNMNAISLLDARTMEWIETVMLDDPAQGAANPWAVRFAGDARRLLVTHAGTHELSVIDFTRLMARVASRPAATGLYTAADLHVMTGIRSRIPLGLNGPRALAERDGVVYVTGYYSDTLAVVDLRAERPAATAVALAETKRRTAARQGEQAFNDASRCRQTWQSCATCHPDGRKDALYWDLFNDGSGNTKNTKSLLMATRTPPCMWRGVRRDAREAIRAGYHHILFAEPLPEEVEAVEAYLGEMRAVPSPHLNASALEPPRTNGASCAKCHSPGVPRGTLTQAARRGKALFKGRAGCAACHPHPTFTSGTLVDPGLGAGVAYDVPSLVEVWRTAPYLHSGDAVNLREAVIDNNFLQRRGSTEALSEQELDDLLAYVRSL